MAWLHKNLTEYNAEVTLTRVALQAFCRSCDFPTYTEGKDPFGKVVKYCYCPICKKETEERNERRAEVKKPPIPFKPPTSWQSSDVIQHMVQFHKLPLENILTWTQNPAELDTLIVLTVFSDPTPNQKNT